MTITGAARLAGVMGWPVSHSRSPTLHNFWLHEYGIDGVYMPLAVAPESFERALGALAVLGFAGVNVTVPHKEAAFAAVDEKDRLAERIGAVNTIVFDENGRARGTNTDAFGFVESLRTRAPGWCSSRTTTSRNRPTPIGTCSSDRRNRNNGQQKGSARDPAAANRSPPPFKYPVSSLAQPPWTAMTLDRPASMSIE